MEQDTSVISESFNDPEVEEKGGTPSPRMRYIYIDQKSEKPNEKMC